MAKMNIKTALVAKGELHAALRNGGIMLPMMILGIISLGAENSRVHWRRGKGREADYRPDKRLHRRPR